MPTNRAVSATRPPLEGAGLLASAGLYLVVVLVPLFAVVVGPGLSRRGFWIELGVALGFIGLAMFGLQSILTARFARVSGTFGQDTLLQFHRQAGLVAFALVAAHPVVLIAADSTYWSYLDPTDELARAVALWAVVLLIPALLVTALWRRELGIPYEWWRLAHGIGAAAVVLIGIVHVFRVQHYLDHPGTQALWAAVGLVSIGSIAYVRLYKPLRFRHHPYRVSAVIPESTGVWTLRLEPEDGDALPFRAGQFAALTISERPYAIEQHPFSVASSAHQRRFLEFTVKELGDFTSTIGQVPVGQRAFVDGPYGGLTLHTEEGGGLFAVAGGIGITPIMSMLRTLADEQSDCPVVLVYANTRWEDVTYAEELQHLVEEGRLQLEVVHVLSDPPEAWTGTAGLIDAEVLGRHLPAQHPERWQYVLCGPPPLMEVAEDALVGHGIPLRRIDSERFDIGASVATGRRQAQIRRSVVALGVLMVAAAALFAAA